MGKKRIAAHAIFMHLLEQAAKLPKGESNGATAHA